ncbi:ATP-binding cassette domain-containing protein [Nocardioides convexus]|uniref:ATP-binding cassette domain-containing protein n=1 Tax=Nocardioides convexus TaxID=2712224 RepID=UPI00241871DC|nr:ATP-binding cassette domain-containing protein [Nocardioides convexus]
MSLLVDVRVAARDVEVAFEVADGETVALLGPNGAGKSTTLDVLGGLLRPDAGRVVLDGEVLTGDGRWRAPHRRRTALLAQDPLLFPHLSVLENVAFGPRSRGTGRSASRAAAEQWLAEVGAGDLAGRRPAQALRRPGAAGRGRPCPRRRPPAAAARRADGRPRHRRRARAAPAAAHRARRPDRRRRHPPRPRRAPAGRPGRGARRRAGGRGRAGRRGALPAAQRLRGTLRRAQPGRRDRHPRRRTTPGRVGPARHPRRSRPRGRQRRRRGLPPLRCRRAPRAAGRQPAQRPPGADRGAWSRSATWSACVPASLAADVTIAAAAETRAGARTGGQPSS